MFTGIVETIGHVEDVKYMDAIEGGCTLLVSHANILKDANLGDSIAVNGVCLTIIQFSAADETVKFGL